MSAVNPDMVADVLVVFVKGYPETETPVLTLYTLTLYVVAPDADQLTLNPDVVLLDIVIVGVPGGDTRVIEPEPVAELVLSNGVTDKLDVSILKFPV